MEDDKLNGLGEYLRRISEVEIGSKQLLTALSSLNGNEKQITLAADKVTDLRDLLKKSCLENLRARRQIINIEKQISSLAESLDVTETQLFEHSGQAESFSDDTLNDASLYLEDLTKEDFHISNHNDKNNLSTLESLPRVHIAVKDHPLPIETNKSSKQNKRDKRRSHRVVLQTSHFLEESTMKIKSVNLQSHEFRENQPICHQKSIGAMSIPSLDRTQKPSASQNYEGSKLYDRMNPDNKKRIENPSVNENGISKNWGKENKHTFSDFKKSIDDLSESLHGVSLQDGCQLSDEQQNQQNSKYEKSFVSTLVKKSTSGSNKCESKDEGKVHNYFEVPFQLLSPFKKKMKRPQQGLTDTEHRKRGTTPIHQRLGVSGTNVEAANNAFGKPEIRRSGRKQGGSVKKNVRSPYLVVPGKSYSDVAKSPPAEKVTQTNLSESTKSFIPYCRQLYMKMKKP